MQRCLKCGRTYEHDTQKFCTHDGGRLAPDDPSSAPTTYDLNQATLTDSYDPEATVTRMPDLNRTIASAPTSEIRSKDTGPAAAPPASPYQPPPPPEPPAQQPTVAFNQPPPPPQQQQFYQPPPPAQPPPPPPAQAPMPPPQHQQHQQHQQQQYAPAQLPPQHAAQAPAAARKKSSRLPLIIGLVVALLVGGAAAWYFLIYKKGNATANANSNSNVTNANANTSTNANANANGNSNTSANANTTSTPTPQPPPPNATQFVNSRASLDGKLAEKYSNFSFYYPNTWERDPKSGVAGASNFIRVERRLPPDFTQENFAVSWYDSKGTLEADQEKVFPKLVESLKAKLSKAYPEFDVLSEGGTTINALNGYELRFQSVSRGTEKGDITLWGWVVFLPPGKEGETNGLQLLMLTTSLAPELESASDVGVKGELPVILNSFRMGKD